MKLTFSIYRIESPKFVNFGWFGHLGHLIRLQFDVVEYHHATMTPLAMTVIQQPNHFVLEFALIRIAF